jgi:hypothetical protein
MLPQPQQAQQPPKKTSELSSQLSNCVELLIKDQKIFHMINNNAPKKNQQLVKMPSGEIYLKIKNGDEGKR